MQTAKPRRPKAAPITASPAIARAKPRRPKAMPAPVDARQYLGKGLLK